MALNLFFVIWVGAIGLSVGSFLNVVIARVPNGESVVRPRSKCPKCGRQLAWHENIPVLSWLMLRGKCAGCGKPISPRYVLVELLTGTLYVVALGKFGLSVELLRVLVFLSLLIPLIFIDAEHWILPFELTLPGIALGVVGSAGLGQEAFVTALIGAVVGFCIFRAMEFLGWAVTGLEALGAGDKYLLAMIGATVGWRPLFGVVLLSSLQGGIYGVARRLMTGRAGPMVESEAAKASEPQAAKPEATPSEGDDEDEGLERMPFTPFIFDGREPLWKRLTWGIPYTIFLQDIPDPPPLDEETGDEPEWVPGASNMPFGPWIGLAGVQAIFLGSLIAEALADTPFGLAAELFFGQ